MIEDKTILITGGTGSFGRKFVEIALRDHAPKRIIIFSRGELKQEQMRRQFNDRRVAFFIGDVRDRDRLYRAFEADLDLVIHAAALKQVPACEYNPFEAIKTNVLGAENIIDAAIDSGVPKVIALSSDKAVSPNNLYGATKLCAEKLFVQGNSYAGKRETRFSCVRYGNVLGSSLTRVTADAVVAKNSEALCQIRSFSGHNSTFPRCDVLHWVKTKRVQVGQSSHRPTSATGSQRVTGVCHQG